MRILPNVSPAMIVTAMPTQNTSGSRGTTPSTVVAAASKLGRSITIPGEDAGDESRAEFIKKLQAAAPNLTLHPDYADDEHAAEFWKMAGVPAEAKGYTVKEGFEGLPTEFVDNLRSVAAAAGWTKKQFRATLDEYAKEYEIQQETLTKTQTEDAGIVKSKWGLAEENKKKSIMALVSKFEDPDHKLGELNAAAYLMLDNIVSAFTGKGPQAFEQPVSNGEMTPGEIDDKIADIDTRLIKEGYTIPAPKRKALLAKKMKLLEMRA